MKSNQLSRHGAGVQSAGIPVPLPFPYWCAPVESDHLLRIFNPAREPSTPEVHNLVGTLGLEPRMYHCDAFTARCLRRLAQVPVKHFAYLVPLTLITMRVMSIVVKVGVH